MRTDEIESHPTSALLICILLSGALAQHACGTDDRPRVGGADTDADADSGVDADSGSNGDAGADAGSQTDAALCAAGGNLYDETSGLCWRNPPSDEFYDWFEADSYCSDLDIGGFDDWRLPLVQELLSTLLGCVGGVATGDLSASTCGVSDPECLAQACFDSGCLECEGGAGPDEEGCYWDPEVIGPCLWFWSTSLLAGDYDSMWIVSAGNGHVGHDGKTFPNYNAWCVHGELQ